MQKALAGSHPGIGAWQPGATDLGALVVGDFRGAEWEGQARLWHASLASEGILLSVGKGRPTHVSRDFLCAGFSDLWQVKVGRTLVTAGRRGPHLS